MSKLVPCAFMLFVCIDLYSQFTNVTQPWGLELGGMYPTHGAGISFYDFNKDGLDDLTIATHDDGIKTYISSGENFEEIYLFGYLPGNLKEPTWLDFDNDDDPDFFIGRNWDYPLLFRNDGDLTFTDISFNLPLSDFNPSSTCHSWGDYDNDSYLDLYLANYYADGEITSWLFHNNGDETFTELATLLGVDNGVSQAYQPLWLDYDLDGDVDLHVVNDKHDGAKLYRNDGPGVFTDVANEFGFNIIGDLMGLAAGDYDNDGDFDYYITNTFDGNFLLRNDNGLLVNVACDYDVSVFGICWGAMFFDSDNDSDQDLYVVEGFSLSDFHSRFYKNSPPSGFSESPVFNAADNRDSFAVARGDINGDGFPDLAVTSVNPIEVTLWQNTPNSDNWIKIGLHGTVSNHDGIGAIVRCYSAGICNMVPMTCGANYMSQDSQYLIFGLAEEITVDSITVTWPLGWVDRFYNLDANALYSFTEGESHESVTSYQVVEICAGNSVELDAGPGQGYHWYNDELTQMIVVDAIGTYEVLVTNVFGSTDVMVFDIVLLPSPTLIPNVTSPSCNGATDGQIQLIYDEQSVILLTWEDASDGNYLYNIGAGTYHYDVTFSNGCVDAGFVSVLQPTQILIEYVPSVVCYGDSTSAELFISEGIEPYTVDWFGENPNALESGAYPFTVLDSNFCAMSGEYLVVEYPEIHVTLEVEPLCFESTTSVEFTAVGGSGDFNFDFVGSDPDNLTAGQYTLIVTDENNCSVLTEFTVEENEEITADFVVQNAMNGSNGSIEIFASGGTPPYSFLWNDDSELFSIENIPQGNYSCVITDSVGCSLTVEANVIDLLVDEHQRQTRAYPNPFQDFLIMNLSSPEIVKVIDAHGKEIYFSRAMNLNLELGTKDWPSGVYFMFSGTAVFPMIKR